MSITLKAHVMEQHIVAYNNKYGVGDKEESFIEQGDQIGMKENQSYHGVTILKMEASLKARTIATHPLVIEQNYKVLEKTK